MANPYKLKSNIVEFIVKKKAENPRLSCRLLVPLIKSELKVNISKSSINFIIKENKLSSPIGRTRIRPKQMNSLRQAIRGTLSRSVAGSALMVQGEPPQAMPESAVTEAKDVTVSMDNDRSKIPVGSVPETAVENSSVDSSSASSLKAEKKNFLKEETGVLTPAYPVHILDSVVRNVQNGGCYLLLAADIKSCLSYRIVQKLAELLPSMPLEFILTAVRVLILKPIFRNIDEIWHFLGKKLEIRDLDIFVKSLENIDIPSVSADLDKIGVSKVSTSQELFKQCLLKLNALTQEIFFPETCHGLDLFTMFDKYYGLKAEVEIKPDFINIHLKYDPGQAKDLVWLEDYNFASVRINDEKLITEEGLYILFDSILSLSS